MIVLKAPTTYRANKIEGLTIAPNIIKFTKDCNNNLIVGKEILTDPAFSHLQNEFAFLEEIQYKPVPTENI